MEIKKHGKGMKKYVFTSLLMLSFYATTASAWDGQDANSGENVEIGSGELVREGENINVDVNGRMHTMDVKNMRSIGSSVEIEVYDNETGETKTLEMER